MMGATMLRQWFSCCNLALNERLESPVGFGEQGQLVNLNGIWAQDDKRLKNHSYALDGLAGL